MFIFFLPTYYRKRRLSINHGLIMYSWFIGNLRCIFLELRCKLYFEVPFGKPQKYKVKMNTLAYSHLHGQSWRKQKGLVMSKGWWGWEKIRWFHATSHSQCSVEFVRGKSKCNTENWYSVKKRKWPGIVWDLERKRHGIRFFKCIECVEEIKKPPKHKNKCSFSYACKKDSSGSPQKLPFSTSQLSF